MFINWKNTAENLFLILISLIFGVIIGYKISVKTAEKMLKEQNKVITEAIKKNTTSISNEFKTEIRKVKLSKSDNTKLTIEPQIQSTIKTQKKDTSKFKTKSKKIKKKGFFKRLFS